LGDSASAEGGFLNSYIDSPSTSSEPVKCWALLTPDDLYPTQVFSLSGDGWANYDNGANDLGMYSDHLEYLGLTSQEIASAVRR